MSRNENIRRIGEVAKLFADASAVVLTAFISPYRKDRDSARELHKKAGLDFIEVFVDAPLSVVEERDPKGLYRKARAGEIKGMLVLVLQLSWGAIIDVATDFTGISAPYEAPENPEIHIKTGEMDLTQSVKMITDYLVEKKYI